MIELVKRFTGDAGPCSVKGCRNRAAFLLRSLGAGEDRAQLAWICNAHRGAVHEGSVDVEWNDEPQ